MRDERTAWLRLALTPALGAERQRKLLAAFGLPSSIYTRSRSAIAAVIGGEGADLVLTDADSSAINTALDWCAEPGNHLLTLADESYPQALLDIADPPIVLYAKGNPELLNRAAIAKAEGGDA